MIRVSAAGATSAEHCGDPPEAEDVAGGEEGFSHFDAAHEHSNSRSDPDDGLKGDDDVAYDEEELGSGLPLEEDGGFPAGDEDRHGEEVADYFGDGEGSWGAGDDVGVGGEGGDEARHDDFSSVDEPCSAECADSGEDFQQTAEDDETEKEGQNGGDGLGEASESAQEREEQSEAPGNEEGDRDDDRDGGDEGAAGKRKKRKKSSKKKYPFPSGAATGGPSRGPVVIQPPPPPPAGNTGTPAPPPMPRVIHPKRHPPPPPSPQVGSPPPPAGPQILTAPSCRPSPMAPRPPSGRATAPFFGGPSGTPPTRASTPASSVASHPGARSSPAPAFSSQQQPPPPPPAAASAPAALGASPSPSQVRQANGPMPEPPPFPRRPQSVPRPGASGVDARAGGPAALRGLGPQGVGHAVGGAPPPPPSGAVGPAALPTIINPPHSVSPQARVGNRVGGPIVLNPPISTTQPDGGSPLPPYVGEAHGGGLSPDAPSASSTLTGGLGRGPRGAAGARSGFYRCQHEEPMVAGYAGPSAAPPAGQPLPGRFGDIRMTGWTAGEPPAAAASASEGGSGVSRGLEGAKGKPTGPFLASPAPPYPPAQRREEGHVGERPPSYGYGRARLDDSGQSAPGGGLQRPVRRPVILSAGAGGRAGGPGVPHGRDCQMLAEQPGYRGGQGCVPQEAGSGVFYESAHGAYGFPGSRGKRERDLAAPAGPPRFETGPGGRPGAEGVSGVETGAAPGFPRPLPGHGRGAPGDTSGSDSVYGPMGRAMGSASRPDFASPMTDIRDIRRRPGGLPLPGHPVHSGATGSHPGASAGPPFGESGRAGGPWGGGSPRAGGPGVSSLDGRPQGFRRGVPDDRGGAYGGEGPASGGVAAGPWGGPVGGESERGRDFASAEASAGFWSRPQHPGSAQQSGSGPFCGGPESPGRPLQGGGWRNEAAMGPRPADSMPPRGANQPGTGGSGGASWYPANREFSEQSHPSRGAGVHAQRHLHLSGPSNLAASQGERGQPGVTADGGRGPPGQAQFGPSYVSPHTHASSPPSAWQQASRPPQSEEAHFRHSGRPARGQPGQGYAQGDSVWGGGKEEVSEYAPSWEPWQASPAGSSGATPGADQAWYESADLPASAPQATGHLGRSRDVEGEASSPPDPSRRREDGDRGQREWQQAGPGYSAGRAGDAGQRQSLRQQSVKGSERETGGWVPGGSGYTERDSSGRRGDGVNGGRGRGHGAARGTQNHGRDGEYGRPGGRGAAEGYGGEAGLPATPLRAHATPGAEPEQKGFTVIVTNVPVDLSAADLHQAFSAVGPLLRTDIMLSSSGERTGRVCFTFSTRQAAEDAVSRFDGGDLNGRCIRVFME
uniref:RNA binding motif-containing protein, putative n=1 Tax=Neospora caninum (strain Liverpool) TaxID=572307 RepID=A0A0F7UD41_NEOCL|nr:TPA: RNA binding motif-containing protein, putative [Neospora caninum Liverpool]